MIPVSKGSPHYPKEETNSSSSGSSSSHVPVADNHWPHSQLFPADNNSQRTASVDFTSGNPWMDPLQAEPMPGPSSSYSMDFPSTSSSSYSATNTNTTAAPANRQTAESGLLSPEEEHKKDLDELLGKIDSTLAKSRLFVAKSQDSSEFAGTTSVEEDYTDGGAMDYYEGAYQNACHMRTLSGGSGTDDTANLITNTRQVKSSLRRLEQTQDELFEL